jgi:hypothetical protein
MSGGALRRHSSFWFYVLQILRSKSRDFCG